MPLWDAVGYCRWILPLRDAPSHVGDGGRARWHGVGWVAPNAPWLGTWPSKEGALRPQ